MTQEIQEESRYITLSMQLVTLLQGQKYVEAHTVAQQLEVLCPSHPALKELRCIFVSHAENMKHRGPLPKYKKGITRGKKQHIQGSFRSSSSDSSDIEEVVGKSKGTVRSINSSSSSSEDATPTITESLTVHRNKKPCPSSAATMTQQRPTVMNPIEVNKKKIEKKKEREIISTPQTENPTHDPRSTAPIQMVWKKKFCLMDEVDLMFAQADQEILEELTRRKLLKPQKWEREKGKFN